MSAGYRLKMGSLRIPIRMAQAECIRANISKPVISPNRGTISARKTTIDPAKDLRREDGPPTLSIRVTTRSWRRPQRMGSGRVEIANRGITKSLAVLAFMVISEMATCRGLSEIAVRQHDSSILARREI